jgi:periplasmic divalent cation tolerance protein
MEKYIQVLTTVADEKKANEVASAVLENRVAACVQVLGPISSFYWWKGKIEQAKEWVCLAKAKAEDYEKLQAVIKSVHPYEVPEILAMPVSFGNPAYLKWVRNETSRKGVDRRACAVKNAGEVATDRSYRKPRCSL